MAKIQRHFLINAPFRAGSVNLRTLADHVDQALRRRRRQKAWWALVLLATLFAVGVVIYETGWDGLVAVIFIGGFIDLILFGYAFTYHTSADILLTRDLSGALNRWRLDVHSASPLKGALDLRYPDDCPPKRTVRSGGGKQKRYYHYVPFNLKFALADGNLMALQVDVKAKTKAGNEIRRTTQIRGRLKLNPALYRAPAVGRTFALHHLNVRCVEYHGEPHLCFWGELAAGTGLAELQQALNALYQELRGQMAAGH